MSNLSHSGNLMCPHISFLGCLKSLSKSSSETRTHLSFYCFIVDSVSLTLNLSQKVLGKQIIKTSKQTTTSPFQSHSFSSTKVQLPKKSKEKLPC